jgi:hypothetical protein
MLKINRLWSLTSLKKESTLSSVNDRLLTLLNPDKVKVVIWRAEKAEVDEM